MFAISMASRRGRGHVVACDLLRVVLKCKNKLTAMRHNEAVYSRLSEDFGGYLVTEPEELTVWRDGISGRVVWVGGGWCGETVDLREGFDISKCDFLDAKIHLPAGATKKYTIGKEVCALWVSFLRDGWYE